MEEYLYSALLDGAAHYDVTLDDSSISRLLAYKDLVAEWNHRMNLVSARDLDRFISYHILDSLKIASTIDFSIISAFLDFGSGAGLPGIPLAISFSNARAVLVESRLKRATFLTHAVDSLPLPNATAIRSRVEDLPVSFNDSYDLVVTRATVNLADFLRLSDRFISSGGKLLAIKGNDIDDELSDLEKYADKNVFHISVTTPAPLEGVRSGTLVTITKR